MNTNTWNDAIERAQQVLRMRLMNDAADAIAHLIDPPSELFRHLLDDGCELVVHGRDGETWGEYEGQAPAVLVRVLLEDWQAEQALDAAADRVE